MPIAKTLYNVLFENLDPKKEVDELMTGERPMKWRILSTFEQ